MLTRRNFLTGAATLAGSAVALRRLAAADTPGAAERAYLEAWRDYWIARVSLERALTGGSNADMGGTSRAASESVSSPGGISSSASTRAAAARGTGE